MERLAGFEEQLLRKQEKQRVSEELVRDRQSMQFDDVVAPNQLKQTDNQTQDLVDLANGTPATEQDTEKDIRKGIDSVTS